MKAEMRMEESEDGWTGTGKVSMEYDGDGHMAWFRLVFQKNLLGSRGKESFVPAVFLHIFS